MRSDIIPLPEKMLAGPASFAPGSHHVPDPVIDPAIFLLPEYAGQTSRLYCLPGFLNAFPDLGETLAAMNRQMPQGGRFFGKVKTNRFFRLKYLQNGLPGRIQYTIDVAWHRVFPKLNRFFNTFYIFLSKGRDKRYSKTETLGRLIAAGFHIQTISEAANGELFFCVTKLNDIKGPVSQSSYWPLFRMRRVGKNGKEIIVYKLRTMHPYAEFVQEYMMGQNGLESTGKFRNDFRVTSWGRVMRKYWIDELPMLYNWIRGDIKFIGVRPISEKFLKIYPEELQAYRNQFKPGLIPPYYADLPGNFEGILLSEKKYLAEYSRHGFRTDYRYFFRIVKNIVIKKARSK